MMLRSIVAALANIPRPALVLGVAGLLPFLLGAWLVAVNLPSAEVSEGVLAGYAAVILAFLGGVHWGTAMAQDRPDWTRLAASVLPSLIGFGALLLGGTTGFLILATAFVLLLAYDLAATRMGLLPAWYPALRWLLTVGVVACLATGALGS